MIEQPDYTKSKSLNEDNAIIITKLMEIIDEVNKLQEELKHTNEVLEGLIQASGVEFIEKI
jgi:hypothetical protein